MKNLGGGGKKSIMGAHPTPLSINGTLYRFYYCERGANLIRVSKKTKSIKMQLSGTIGGILKKGHHVHTSCQKGVSLQYIRNGSGY